ncbi:hypothetical protein [Peribacillus simplex]|uniref:Uncharacterized protein n=1 Tax=Peribacillus simplex TaxID=1478 RepID=A0AAW7IGQ0_9BACI|nr:hypothetical protein [Peribacillus simplex]MDM5454073.1 hypothetical protein [Peribacillus simplex]
MDSNDKSKDFLMQELLKLKLSLRHELNRVTQIIDHLNPDQEAVPPLKDVSIHNELLDVKIYSPLLNYKCRKVL